MKNLTKAITAIVFTAASFTTLAATEVSTVPVNAQRQGVINASVFGNNLDELQKSLAEKAAGQGATSFQIISASGNNHLYGTAVIYK